MDRFKVFTLHFEPVYFFYLTQFFVDRPNSILDEHRVILGLLGQGTFIFAFEQGIDRRTGALFNPFDQIFEPDMLAITDFDPNGTALVVGTPLADFLGTGAKRGDRDRDAEDKVGFLPETSGHAALVFHQTGSTEYSTGFTR